MKTDITHITQLTREDLRQLAAATNPKPGFLIRIENTPDGIGISVNETAFKTAVFGFLRNISAIPAACQPTQAEIDATSCIPV